MKLKAYILTTFTARIVAEKSLLPKRRITKEIVTPNELSCPDPIPNEGSTCQSQFSCDFDIFCCPEDDTICVPETSCFCDEVTSLVVCYEKIYEISCPSMCPSTPPETSDDCTLESHFLCNYGDPFDCKETDLEFEFERQCSCYNGKFVCSDNVCPVSCPADQPEDGDKCFPFATGSCEYGSFCCPGEGGKCTVDKECYCNDISTCYDTTYSIPCPEVCPETPPNSMDGCDIDSRFECNYGDAFSCENSMDGPGGSSFDLEKQCFCHDGIFSCVMNACPEKCPDVQPVAGSSCSPFINYNCNYGQICCPEADGNNCVSMTECSCDNDLKTNCYTPSIVCPSLCPESEPKNGQECDLEERYKCSYSGGSCTQTLCTCQQGTFVCDEICIDDDDNVVVNDDDGNPQDPTTIAPGKETAAPKGSKGKKDKKDKKKEKKSTEAKEAKRLKKHKKEAGGKNLRKGKKE
jgi:hypothetical protein